MRTSTAPERALIAAHRMRWALRVEMQGLDGGWRELTALGGRNWVLGARWRWNLDQPVMSGELQLHRSVGAASLAPLMATSSLNQTGAGGTAGPQVDARRRVRISTNTMGPGAGAPASGDWREMFNGYTDKYDEGGGDRGVMAIPMRDLGALLQDTVTEVERVYGSAGGIDGATVMASILSDNAGILGASIPLYVPVAIAVAVRTYKIPIGTPIMEALNAIARKAGAVVRYEYDAAHVFRLTFYRPDKTKVIPDYTFATSEYLSLDEVSGDIAGLRNVVAVPFTDSALGGTGLRLVVWAEASAPNLLQYGRRAMILGQEATSQINSTAEATALANAARDDTAYPYSTGKATHRLTWWVQGGDLLRYASDGRHSSSNLDIGVMQFEHSIQVVGNEVQGRTSVVGRPNIAVLYHTWLRLAVDSIDEAVRDAMLPIISIKLLDTGSTNLTVDYQVDAQMPDGSAVSVIYWALGDNAYVSTVASGGIITVPRATNDSGDRLLRVKAVGSNGWSDEQVVTIDYDAIPAISAVAEAIPIYSTGVQVGWRLKGSVDDDTRALVIALTAGLTLSTVSPAGAVGGDGNYWLDTTNQKTWSIDLLQSAGARGTLTLTPREFYNSAAGGLGGLPYVLTLERPGITTATARDIDSTTREVTLTAQPNTATINYRVDGGVWQLATGKITFTLDVSGADRVVEFYSTTASGSTEDQKRLTVDRNAQPGITATVLTESSANNLRLVMGFDDDVTHWRMWARRNLWPTVNSLDPSIGAGPPLDEYKRYDGGMEKTTLDWRAGGNGDSTSWWYIVIRAYDDVGNFVQAIAAILVSGAPAAVGALSNVRAQSNTEGGNRYNDILWDHNQTVQDVAHTVTIRESDNGAAFVQVVAGRDAKTEHDNASVVALVGGYHLQKPGANPGDPGAVFKTFDYQIDLRRTSDNALLATYTASMSAWYAGGGGGGAPPAEIPNTLAAFGEQLQARGTWANTNATALLHLEWERWNGAAYVVVSSQDLAAAVATNTLTGLTAGDLMRFRVRYYNGFGNGTWSAYSASVIVQAAGSPPTETPSAPTATTGSAWRARAAWTNTSTAYQLFIEWYRKLGGVGGFVFDNSLTMAAGSSQTALLAFTDPTAGDRVYFRVRYFNSVGNGPWSSDSNQVDLVP